MGLDAAQVDCLYGLPGSSICVASDGAREVEHCSNTCENSGNESTFRDCFLPLVTNSANPKYLGVSGKLIIRRHFRRIFFKLVRPRAGLANIFEDACPNCAPEIGPVNHQEILLVV